MKLFFARHGQTVSNIESRIGGCGLDSLLTDEGRMQAAQLGERLKRLSFDAVYASPLKRAMETATIALGGRYDIIIDERLREIGFGVMEGMYYGDAYEQYPQSSMFMTDPAAYIPPPGGESLEDMIQRVNAFLENISQKNHETVLIVTHGYFLRVLYSCVNDGTVSGIGKSPGYENCELLRYGYQDGQWKQGSCP